MGDKIFNFVSLLYLKWTQKVNTLLTPGEDVIIKGRNLGIEGDIETARKIIAASEKLCTFAPENTAEWNKYYKIYLEKVK